MSYTQMAEFNTLYQRWLNDVEYLIQSIRADETMIKTQGEHTIKELARLVGRIGELLKRIVEKGDQEKHRGASPFTIPSKVATSLQQCNHCGSDIALLIFGDNASDLAGLEAYAQLMAEKIKITNLPTFVLAPPNDPSSEDNPSLLLKVHPSIGTPFLITPDEWLNLLEKMSNTHCKPSKS